MSSSTLGVTSSSSSMLRDEATLFLFFAKTSLAQGKCKQIEPQLGQIGTYANTPERLLCCLMPI